MCMTLQLRCDQRVSNETSLDFSECSLKSKEFIRGKFTLQYEIELGTG